MWKEPFDIPDTIGKNDIFTVMLNSGEVLDVEAVVNKNKISFYREGNIIQSNTIRLYRQESPVNHIKKCKSCGDWR